MERYPCKFVVVMLGVLAWASLLVAASATAADINNEPVNAVCDWSVYGDNTNANYDYSSALLVGSDTGGNWTSVIKFDISSLASAYPPSHWDLDEAILKIRCDELDLGSTVDLAVGALVTAQTCSSDWNDYINSNYWPGGSETVTSGNCTGNWLTFSSGDLTIMFRNMWTGGWSSDDVALWPSPWWPGAYAEFYPENSSSEPYFEVDLNCDDDDGDGYADEGCGSAYGDDCNDLYSNINPGAVEVCGNGVDEDCSGADLVCPVYDGDGDGYEGPSGDGSDCNDGDAATYPGAPELCDGDDNNCDGSVPSNEVDNDGDGDDECGDGDCDDSDDSIYQGAPELCDGEDNDCSGSVPGNEIDDDGDGYSECEGDCEDGSSALHPGASEACDGADTNCDGITPNSEDDDDNDGFMVCEDDCDDSDSDINPWAEEICDGVDNDCDGSVDEGCGDDDDGADDDDVDDDDVDDDDDDDGYEVGAGPCSDGTDNDNDGMTDCEDPACTVEEFCDGSSGGSEQDGCTCSVDSPGLDVEPRRGNLVPLVLLFGAACLATRRHRCPRPRAVSN